MNNSLKHNYGKFALMLPLFLIGLAGTRSCEKTEGTGGTASISGTILRQEYNDDYSMMIQEEPAVDEEIFIVYGNDEFLGDRAFTNHDGKFTFKFLRQGNYTIYYLSEDSTTLINDDTEVILDVTLKNGEQKDLGNLITMKTLDWNDGSATITGVVKLINYTNESQWPNLVIKDISYAQEQEIYIIYGNHAFYDERIRTNYDGTFEFHNLIPGNYRVFVYSEDVTGGTEMVTIFRNATISEKEQVVNVGEIMIEKH